MYTTLLAAAQLHADATLCTHVQRTCRRHGLYYEVHTESRCMYVCMITIDVAVGQASMVQQPSLAAVKAAACIRRASGCACSGRSRLVSFKQGVQTVRACVLLYTSGGRR